MEGSGHMPIKMVKSGLTPIYAKIFKNILLLLIIKIRLLYCSTKTLMFSPKAT
jgi:hypothetical protein